MSAQIMVNDDVRHAIKQMQQKARLLVAHAMVWRDRHRPLGRRHAPELNPVITFIPNRFGLSPTPAGAAGRALAHAAHGRHPAHVHAALSQGAAQLVQHAITDLAPSFRADSTRNAINLFYLQHLADATLLAARACFQLQHGSTPSDAERMKRAVAWVVILATARPDAPAHADAHYAPVLCDPRVKQCAVLAYPLFTAGRPLDHSLEQAGAIRTAFEALFLV